MTIPNGKSIQNRKPFRLLRLMTSKDIRRFAVYLGAAPFEDHPSKKLVAFWEKCLEVEIWKRTMSRDAFLQVVGLSMSGNAFDKLISQLYNALIAYIGLKKLHSEGPLVFTQAIHYLQDLAIEEEELDKKMGEGLRELEKYPPDEDYFQHAFSLNKLVTKGKTTRAHQPDNRGLTHVQENLDGFYCIAKLRFLCASINEQYIYGNYWEQTGEDELEQWFAKMYPKMPLLGRIYYHVYNILKRTQDQDHFAGFSTQLMEWESRYGGMDELNDLFGYLLNYYLRRYNAGDMESLPRLNDLYDVVLQKELILENDRISPEQFKNIVAIKCRNAKVEEACQFFDQFKDRLTDDQDGFAIQYNQVYIQFFQGDYEVVHRQIEVLMKDQGSKVDVHYGLDLRCLLLKTLFRLLMTQDMDEWDQTDEKMQSLSRSFYGYIQRKSIAQMSKVRFENYRKAVQRLYQFYFSGAEAEPKEKLLNEFKSSSNLPDKGWFIDQLS